MIQIHGLSAQQSHIVDLLWKCKDLEEVDNVISEYGQDAMSLKEVLLIECQEAEVTSELDCEQAKHLLSKF